MKYETVLQLRSEQQAHDDLIQLLAKRIVRKLFVSMHDRR